MSELNHNEILRSPGIVMFLTFISSLLGDGKATFSDGSNQIILLNNESSNYFLLGRDDKITPFIGVQESMIPWFLEMPWKEVALCPKEKYIYLIAKENNIPVFVLGLKPRAKRMITLVDPKFEKVENIIINIKIFKILKNELAVSHNNALSGGLSVKWVNSIYDIMKEESNKEVVPTQENLSGFNFIKKKPKDS